MTATNTKGMTALYVVFLMSLVFEMETHLPLRVSLWYLPLQIDD